MFYKDKSSISYNINSNTFHYLNKFLDDGDFKEEEIDKTLSYDTYYFNNLKEINKYQVRFVVNLLNKDFNRTEMLQYIDFIKTENDLLFFDLMIRKFIYSNNLKKYIEKYIYKQLPNYMLEKQGNKKSFYYQLLEEKGDDRDYNQIPEDFHEIKMLKLIMKVRMKGYLDLYNNHEEELNDYLKIDWDKSEKEVNKLEKLVNK